MNTIQINPADNVIVALSPLAKGTAVAVPGVGEVVAAEDIPQGHKMAVRSIAAGGGRHQVRPSYRPCDGRCPARSVASYT